MAQIPPPFDYPECDPKADADAIRKATKGGNIDEEILIKIICNRSREQLKTIASAFEANHGRKLALELKSQISGNFQHVLSRRFEPPLVLKAKAIGRTTDGLSGNEERLIDCLAFTPNVEVPVLKSLYTKRYTDDLTQALVETSGELKIAFKALMDGDRDETFIVDKATLHADVERLKKAIETKDEHLVAQILCKNAPWYNVRLNQVYSKAHGDLTKALESTFSYGLKKLFRALILAPHEYWADRLYYSLKPTKPDNKTIVFIFTFLERHDLQYIATLINDRHKASLQDLLKAKLTEDYLKATLEIAALH